MRDTVTSRRGEVPLGIFCRRSLTPYLDADNLFDLTKRGFAFFEEEFDCAYPFEKYDQLFTPEYNMGAMENAGCVTINEMYVFRSKVTESLVERRALTVLHELAHMWFGNLVTMRWWNDLWLNESFAEWASTTCQSEATHWTDAWTTFGTHEKDWAYRQDQLSSTHPIVAEIRDLQDVEVNFDGITYAKGASVLKQLVAHVGREPFRDGLRAYFAKHAWGNTTLDDLLAELEATSGRDLRTWSHAVARDRRGQHPAPGRSRSTTGAGSPRRSSSRPAPRASRRCARTPWRIGLYAVRDGAAGRAPTASSSTSTARAPRCPSWSGASSPTCCSSTTTTSPTPRSGSTSARWPPPWPTRAASPRSLPRSLVLASLWDMTRDAEMGARHFVDVVLETLPGESDSTLLRTLIAQLQTAVHSYSAPEHRDALRVVDPRPALGDRPVAPSPAATPSCSSSAPPRALTAAGDDTTPLRALLDGTEVLDGLTVDFEMRWTLLTALAAAGAADAAEIDAERAREDTATGRERAARARAARPTAEAKEEAWAAAVEGSGLPNAVVEAVALGFTRPGTSARPAAPVRRALPRAARHRRGAAARTPWSRRSSTASTRARSPTPRCATRTQAWLDANPHAPAALRRLVVENRDPVVRALAAQERDARD